MNLWMNMGSGWPCCSFASSVLEIGCANGAHRVEENIRQVNLLYLHQYHYTSWHQKLLWRRCLYYRLVSRQDLFHPTQKALTPSYRIIPSRDHPVIQTEPGSGAWNVWKSHDVVDIMILCCRLLCCRFVVSWHWWDMVIPWISLQVPRCQSSGRPRLTSTGCWSLRLELG